MARHGEEPSVPENAAVRFQVIDENCAAQQAVSLDVDLGSKDTIVREATGFERADVAGRLDSQRSSQSQASQRSVQFGDAVDPRASRRPSITHLFSARVMSRRSQASRLSDMESNGAPPRVSVRMLQSMAVEDLDCLEARMVAEQRRLIQDVDLALERDPKATCDGSLSWKDISFSVEVPDGRTRTRRTILEPCTGHVDAGSLVALMGPSGSGKTTLLDILAGKKNAPYDGTVLFNGHERDKFFPRVAAYVAQSELMPEHWTVYEAVEFTSTLKKPRPKSMTGEEHAANLDQLLKDLGLLHVRNSCIGGDRVRGISGGQRKRASLARALVSGAHIMFCDEPTSGLSSTDAELCVKVLRVMATKWGATVIVVIHQPRVEVFRMFDQLILLTAMPGRVVYTGEAAGAAEYFKESAYPVPVGGNPADHFLDVITPGLDDGAADRLAERWIEEQLPREELKVAKILADPGSRPLDLLAMAGTETSVRQQRSVYGANFQTQLRAVLWRKLSLNWRNSSQARSQVFGSLLVAAGVGSMFFDVGSAEPKGAYQLPFLFNMVMHVAMSSHNLMPLLILERTMVVIETGEKLYSPWAFVFAHFIEMGSIAFIANTLYISVMWAFGQIGWAYFHLVFLQLTLAWFVMDSMASAIAALARTVDTAQAIGLPPILISIMFSGLMVNKKSNSPMRVLCNVSPLYWVNEMMAWDLYGHDPEAWASLNFMFGFEKPDRLVGLTLIFGQAAVFRALQVFGLTYLNRVQK